MDPAGANVSNTAAVLTIIGGNAAFTALVVGVQSLWIGRALDAMGERIGRVEDALQRVETKVGDQGERLARIEGRLGIAAVTAEEGDG